MNNSRSNNFVPDFNPFFVRIDNRNPVTNNNPNNMGISLSAPNVVFPNMDSQINAMVNNQNLQQPFNNARPNIQIQQNHTKAKFVPCDLDEKNIQLDISLVVKEFMDLAEELRCPICLNLVLKPKECKSCSTVFCGKCIDEWCKNKSSTLLIRPSSACPMKCVKYEESPINKKFQNIINKIKVMCPNTTMGCCEILSYEETMKHIRTCNYIGYRCLGCNFTSKKSEMELHVKSCANLTEPCNLCKIEIKRKEKPFHMESCAYKPVTCRFCRAELTLKTLATHSREDCVLKTIEMYERANIEKKINSKFFSNIYTSTVANFEKSNLVSQNQHVMEITDSFAFHYRKGHAPTGNNDVITIIEFSSQVTFKTIEVLIDINKEIGKFSIEKPFILKVHTSLEGINWSEVSEIKLSMRPEYSFKMNCAPSNAKFILFNSKVPFTVIYFKLLA